MATMATQEFMKYIMYSFFAHFNFILASWLSLFAHIVRYSFFSICNRQIGICSPLMLSAYAYSHIMSYHVMIDRFSLGSWHLQHNRLIVHSVIVGLIALATAASASSLIIRSSGLLISITGMLPVLNMTYHVSNNFVFGSSVYQVETRSFSFPIPQLHLRCHVSESFHLCCHTSESFA